MEVAKALGGSFKLVMLAPKTVREMTQLPKETQKNGDTNKSKRANKHDSATEQYLLCCTVISWQFRFLFLFLSCIFSVAVSRCRAIRSGCYFAGIKASVCCLSLYNCHKLFFCCCRNNRKITLCMCVLILLNYPYYYYHHHFHHPLLQ